MNVRYVHLFHEIPECQFPLMSHLPENSNNSQDNSIIRIARGMIGRARFGRAGHPFIMEARTIVMESFFAWN